MASSTLHMKSNLQSLLDDKEKQLQQAATLGQRVLAQQMELEERIRQLEELDEDDDGDKYRELAETISTWDTENAQLSSGFGSMRQVNGASPSLPLVDLPREEPDRSKASASTSAAQSRRAKNAAHRADDVEFAFEIGSGLLNEVRRLQSLLGERDKAIQDMKEEKDDLEASLEGLRTALKQQEQSADKYKEENWNLEVTLQELRASHANTLSNVQALNSDQKRLTKLLSSTRDASDAVKSERDAVQAQFEALTAKHETDIALARKHAAGLARDKSDLQSAVDTLKQDVEKAKRTRLFPRYGSPNTPNGSEAANDFLTPADDVFSNHGGASTNRRNRLDASGVFDDGFNSDVMGDSPEASPVRSPFLAPNHPANEIEALKQKLAHANRQIVTLKGTVQRERQMRKQAGLVGEGEAELRLEDDNEDYEDEEPTKVFSKPKGTPARVGVRGRGRGKGARGRGGMTLTERLMAANSPSSQFDDEEFSAPAPPVPPIPIQFHSADGDGEGDGELLELGEPLDEDEFDFEDSEPTQIQGSPIQPPSNRASVSSLTSVEGMDPAFANVLKRAPSVTSITGSPSPLRESVLRRSARGGTRRGRGRGGAFGDKRPDSLVGLPEDLGGLLASGMGMVEEVEKADCGCQTEPEAVVEVLHVEMGVQVVPEPVHVPVPVVKVMAEMSIQTAAEPVVPTAEIAVQHAYVEPKPVLISVSAGTEPLAMVQTEVQTTAVSPDLASRRDTITQHDVANITADSSADRTMRAFLVPTATPEGDDDGEETETEPGAETETDMDDYHDASQSVMLTTPSASQDDFRSMLTMTDNGGYSDSEVDDGESIKASRLPSHVGGSAASGFGSRSSFYSAAPPPPTVEYESKSVEADLVEEPTFIAPVIAKPEVREMSIQTDAWEPPAPPPAVPFPEVPIAPALYRVGATNQQFQFIPPASSSATPSAAPVPILVPIPSSAVFRSSSIKNHHVRATSDDRRQSIDSAISSVIDDNAQNRSRAPSAANTLNVIDKTKPPMMMLPPPPRAPPPPGSMAPPPFIPERRTVSHDIPPPRPSSPPPPELIQRATTPTFGSVLSVPGRFGSLRQHGSSMPPSSQQALRQPSSTSSFRSAAAGGGSYSQYSSVPPSGLGAFSVRERERERREMSTTSLTSERSMASPRSSMSSDHNPYLERSMQGAAAPVTPNKLADMSNRTATAINPTDPAVIHAITQTMIGEFLYKYTRRTIGKGHGEKRHKRFFWVHPYTRTLYWSSADPGSSNVSESSAKSAYVDGVRSVLDPNPMPPGLYQYSVVVSTPQREMKITAPTKERHDIWMNALKYLLSRPAAVMTSPSNAIPVPESPVSGAEFDDAAVFASPQSQRSTRSARQGEPWNTTPRGQRSRSQLSVGGSLSKRSGTPAAEYLRWNGPESPYSPSKSFVDVHGGGDEDDLDFELHGDSRSDDGFEGLENVRACCDGRHTVGHSGHHHHHHHHHDHLSTEPPQNDQPLEHVRPVSPSAWSFRSRTGSNNSHDGGTTGSMFSWGRRDDGKLRFGSRRSTKTVATQQ